MNKQIKAGADIHAGDGGYSEGTQEQYDAFVKVRNKSLAQGRIRQLAEQAGFDNRGSNHTAYMNFDHEKFAELIVRECIDIADEYDGAGSTIVSRIEKHFGVE
jgi:hypothetical protein